MNFTKEIFVKKSHKALLICTGLWASVITIMTVQNAVDTKFNLLAIQKMVAYMEQQQYDGVYSKIVNDLKEPPH